MQSMGSKKHKKANPKPICTKGGKKKKKKKGRCGNQIVMRCAPQASDIYILSNLDMTGGLSLSKNGKTMTVRRTSITVMHPMN